MDAGIIKSESFISSILCAENVPICSQIHSSHVLCKLHFPKSFANWLPTGFGQWEAWQLGRREKQGYYFPFLSTSGCDSRVGCTFPVIPVYIGKTLLPWFQLPNSNIHPQFSCYSAGLVLGPW